MKPKKTIFKKDTLRLIALSDCRVQKIKDIEKFIHSIEPVDILLYAGDDIGRFEEEGVNYFSELSEFTTSNQVLAVIGNDDSYTQKRILRAKGVHDLYDQSYFYKNFAFIGLEASTSGPASLKHKEKDFEKHLKHQFKKISGKRLIVVSHTPPYGILDRGIRFAELDKNTNHIGSTALRHFIETKPVELVICGHCHSHGGMTDRLGNTVIANVSSHDDPGAIGNFAIIELTKDGIIDVEWHDTLETLEKDSLEQIHGIGPVKAEKLMKSGVSKISQLAEYENLPELAQLSDISEEKLREFQLKAKSQINNEIYQIATFNINFEKKILFDIETDIAQERVWLIGLQIDEQFMQLFAKNWEQENEILMKFNEILENNPDHVLISYSGNNFDQEVLVKAMRRYEINTEIMHSHLHIDLCVQLKKSFIFPIQDYKLKNLGSFLGYQFKHTDLDGRVAALSYQKHV